MLQLFSRELIYQIVCVQHDLDPTRFIFDLDWIKCYLTQLKTRAAQLITILLK